MKNSRESASIVVVDDDKMTRYILRLILQENGFRVIGEAGDGESAIETCIRLKPDVAFVDINLPKLDGHATVDHLRRISPQTDIIMISSAPTVTNVQRALQNGASSFVVKPFNAAKVLSALSVCPNLKR